MLIGARMLRTSSGNIGVNRRLPQVPLRAWLEFLMSIEQSLSGSWKGMKGLMWQVGLFACVVCLFVYLLVIYTRTHPHPPTHTHTHPHPPTHTHTHTHIHTHTPSHTALTSCGTHTMILNQELRRTCVMLQHTTEATLTVTTSSTARLARLAPHLLGSALWCVPKPKPRIA
jgi:hypothetical protein